MMIVASVVLLLGAVSGQNCATKFGNIKASKIRKLCKEDATCQFVKRQCTDIASLAGPKDCNAITSSGSCNNGCTWVADKEGTEACRSVCTTLVGTGHKRARKRAKKECRKPHNVWCRWVKEQDACIDISDVPATCSDIIKPFHCRIPDREYCEWVEVSGQKVCRNRVVESSCAAILDRRQCRAFKDNGRGCHWESWPVISCFEDTAANCQVILEPKLCNEAQDRYGHSCSYNDLGSKVYEDDNGKMNSKEGFPVARCQPYVPCASHPNQASCQAGLNLVGDSCYWNPSYVGGANAGASTAPYRCKEAQCSTITDKYTCKHFKCFWSRKFRGWDKVADNDKSDKHNFIDYTCQDP